MTLRLSVIYKDIKLACRGLGNVGADFTWHQMTRFFPMETVKKQQVMPSTPWLKVKPVKVG